MSEESDVDRLEIYRSKRDFTRTPEPSGHGEVEPGEEQRRFVVQCHRARRLHFDLRLEVDGVLASWAVPRGPTMDPGVRRMAIHTEDHPVQYLDFEGVIPKGEYGAGDMIVWDTGSYEPLNGDPREALGNGELKFRLDGERLTGEFVLVRTGRRGEDGSKWLLIKHGDAAALSGWEIEDPPRSVLSGRTNDEVRHRVLPPPTPPNPDQRWHGASASQLDALDEIARGGAWHFDGVELRLTNLDKVLFPPQAAASTPLVKRDLIRHYALVAPHLLPYLVGRAVNLQRFPSGIDAAGFWQKNVPAKAPSWWQSWHDADARPGRTDQYSVIERPAALAWLANLATVELHPWTSSCARPGEPDWALIDIDPGTDTTFDDVIVLARLFRTALEHLGVLGGPKVSGQRGIQIWVPIGPGHSYDQTRDWVESLSRMVSSLVPELVSWNWKTDERHGRARLDFTQNALHRTLVAPWSVRPRPGAPVSVPIGWEELDDPALRGDRWTIADVPERLATHGDPLAPLIGLDQRLPSL